jgi:hypothetical protein
MCAMQFDGAHPSATLKSLVKKGMLVERKENRGGRPPMTVTRYYVPLGVHMLWCRWCSENVPDEGFDEGPVG